MEMTQFPVKKERGSTKRKVSDKTRMGDNRRRNGHVSIEQEQERPLANRQGSDDSGIIPYEHDCVRITSIGSLLAEQLSGGHYGFLFC